MKTKKKLKKKTTASQPTCKIFIEKFKFKIVQEFLRHPVV